MTAPGVTFVTEPPSTRHAVARAIVAAVLLVTVIVFALFAGGFPGNAPVEQAFFFIFAVSMIGGVIALIPLAIRAGTRSTRPLRTAGTSTLSMISLPLTVIPLAAYVPLSLVPTLAAAADGERLRYMTETFIVALLSGPIVLGIVFAVVGLRRGGAKTLVFSVVSLAAALLLVIAIAVPTVLYGLGLTD